MSTKMFLIKVKNIRQRYDRPSKAYVITSKDLVFFCANEKKNNLWCLYNIDANSVREVNKVISFGLLYFMVDENQRNS